MLYGLTSTSHLLQIVAELDSLSRDYPFEVPAYFALILRAFSVIEGIALRVDPQYAIVKECFPYLSRRLLIDNHPRTRTALRQLLYGVGMCKVHATPRNPTALSCSQGTQLEDWP